VHARPFFHPLSALPAYAGIAGAADGAERRPVSYRLASLGVNLPSALRLGEGDVDTVCRALLDVLRRASR
jgi:dTDP-4-amino-4,6-dideoxygalactose transaminase